MKISRFFLLYLISFGLFAQTNVNLSDAEYAGHYRKAVQLYADQRYTEAQDKFSVLTQRKYTNAMVPYAHYYAALAAFKLKKYSETRFTIRQLIERFPEWEKLDEAHYLFADAAFAENYTDDAMNSLAKISDSGFKDDVEALQYHYFKKITETYKLKQLNQKYPNNGVIARFLVDAIQKSKFSTKEDLELSDRLTNRFKLGNSSARKPTPNSAVEDNVVNVAAFLPFRFSEFDSYRSARGNQYLYDMYAGMKVAQEKLKSEGITVKLFAYDIDRDTYTVNNVVNSPNFNQADLIIGPLYPDANQIASNFAKDNRTVQLHPLSNNLSLVENEKLTFLAQPSFEMQAQKGLEFISMQYPSKSVAIYFGNSKKDSTFAYAYRDKAMAKGYTITAIKKYTGLNDIDGRKVGHIFIAGSEASFGSKVITAIDRKKVAAPIISVSSAFDFEGNSLSVFNRDLYLIQLDYIDREKEEVKNFRSSYINAQNIIPSYFSYYGYDLLLFYGRMLSRGKAALRTQFDAIEYTQGYTLSGFDYTDGSNENKIVPILKYQDGRFVEVSR